MTAPALVERWPLVGRWDELEAFDQVLSRRTRDGVLLVGPAGVGKTRLADELRRRCDEAGLPTVGAVASRTAASAPLGALAHLLPPDVVRAGTADPALAFRSAADEFAATRPALVVDDLHLLDATSLTLLAQLVTNGLVFLVGTVRSDEERPDGVDVLLRSDRVARVDLGALSRDDVDTLLHLTLGGPVTGYAAAALWNASQGNVLFLRELVLGGRASGALHEIDGVWTLAGELSGTGRLAELLSERVRLADPAGVPVLELLAVCGAAGVDHAAQIAPLDVLAGLEDNGLVRIVSTERRRNLVLAHPLYGELLRASLGELRSRALLVDQAGRVAADGARRREDPLLIATWQVEAGVAADPVLLLQAARLARYAHDFVQVERLARAAHREAPSPDASLLLGEALYELGRFPEAEDVLAPADEACAAAGDASRVAADLATVRSVNLTWGLRRVPEALEVRRRARELATDEDARGVLLAGEAAVLTFSGRPLDAIALLEAEPAATTPHARVARAIAESPALAFAGRTEAALQLARDGFEEHNALGDVVAMANPGSHVIAQVLALAEAGALAEALDLAGFVHEIAVASGIPLPRMWATLNLGRVSLLAGRPATARRWFMECSAVAGATGFVAIRRLALSGIAMTAALLDDAAASQAATDELAVVEDDESFVAPELWLGPAWTAVATHDPARARELLATGAREADVRGHRTSESWLLHEIARLGAPEDVVDRLAQLAEVCDGVLVSARARHAAALARHDGAALEDVAEQFATMSAGLYAAEAAVAASDAYRRANEARRAAAMHERAASLIALCEGARTPGLVATETVVPLTRREREIALLAAEGIASKEIGERLFLSARTVDNHLQRVYTKLGVTRRADLAEALRQRGEAS